MGRAAVEMDRYRVLPRRNLVGGQGAGASQSGHAKRINLLGLEADFPVKKLQTVKSTARVEGGGGLAKKMRLVLGFMSWDWPIWSL
jgi:hypothetical protein